MLVERLLASQTTPIIGVIALAGYVKTTLLAQWAERKGGRAGDQPRVRLIRDRQDRSLDCSLLSHGDSSSSTALQTTTITASVSADRDGPSKEPSQNRVGAITR